MSARMDVAVVGAGFAGLAAARELAEHGVAVEVFEARDRVGGRAITVQHPGDALAVELGPEFVHGRPEATLALLREAEVPRDPVANARYMVRSGKLVPAPELWSRFGELLHGVDPAHDESAQSFLDRHALAREDVTMFASFVEGFYAAPLDDISIASVAADASVGSGAADQARVRGGYGVLSAWLEARLERLAVPLHLGCAVRAIDRRGEPIVLELGDRDAAQTTTAARVIVTVPVGVLAARDEHALRFTPALDEPHASALEALAMGQVVKIVICLRSPVWQARAPRELAFVQAAGGAFPTFWVRSSGNSHQLTAWAGGPRARSLACYGEDARVELALDGFAAALAMPRAELADAVRDHHTYDYAADPFARGAYSYTRVGRTNAAQTLARPLGGTSWITGEATDPEIEGTVGGALASGQRAAREVIASLAPRGGARR